jgi:hypothetical protein
VVNIVIVAHTARTERVKELHDQIDADHIVWDDGTLGAGGNHRQAWQWHIENPSDIAVVIEDDAIPCPHFRDQLVAVMDAAPTNIVSLYLGRQRPTLWQDRIKAALQRSDQSKACFITGQHLLHCVAIATTQPQAIHRALCCYSIHQPDEALSIWTSHTGTNVAYTVPSLVDHADLPTLVTNRLLEPERHPGRKAWRHGTRKTWNNMSVPLIAAGEQ